MDDGFEDELARLSWEVCCSQSLLPIQTQHAHSLRLTQRHVRPNSLLNHTQSLSLLTKPFCTKIFLLTVVQIPFYPFVSLALVMSLAFTDSLPPPPALSHPPSLPSLPPSRVTCKDLWHFANGMAQQVLVCVRASNVNRYSLQG